MAAYPNLALSARANRGFLAHAVRFLVAEADIRQFLDIDTGIPTANTHEVAQQVAPVSRIVSTWTTTLSSLVVHTLAGLVH